MSKSETRQLLEELHRLRSLVSVLSWVAARFDKAVDAIEKQQSIDDVLRELGEYLSENLERIDHILLLILEKLPDNGSKRLKAETAELRQQTIKSRIQSLRVQLQKHQTNLNWLEEKSATYGINVTLEITNGIIFEREKIQELENEIEYLNQQVEK